MPANAFKQLYRAYGGIGRGSLFFSYRWAVFPHELVSKSVPDEGLIYDLGCGYGIFSLYLALQSPRREIEAIDFSERRVASGQRAVARLALKNIAFKKGDVFQFPLRSARAVILNDFLHHLPFWEDQQKLLARACAALEPGGRLVVVDVAPRPFWKFRLGWFVDHVMYFGDHICYLRHGRFVKFLEEHGLKEIVVSPLDAGRPYSNVLYTAVKR